MNLLSKIRKPFVFAALTLALVLSSAFIPLSAGSVGPAGCVMYSKEIRYYSDATYTDQVGTGMIYCNGTGTLTGTSSAYRQEEILDVCCRQPGTNSCVPC
jgi:hypothetical protein